MKGCVEIGIIYANMPAKLDLTALSKLKLLYLTSNGENQVTASGLWQYMVSRRYLGSVWKMDGTH